MRMRALSGMLLALCLALLAACDRTPPPPLSFGASTWGGYAPMFLAHDLGYLPAERMRFTEYASSAEAGKAVRDGALHAAAMTLEEALVLRREVPNLKIVLLLDNRAAQDMPDVLVVRDELIGEYHHDLLQLLEGWQRALDYVRAEPDKAAVAMAQRAHLDAVQFAQAMQGVERYDLPRNRELMMGEPPQIASRIEAMQRALMNRGALQMGAEAAILMDATLLSGALDRNPAPESAASGS